MNRRRPKPKPRRTIAERETAASQQTTSLPDAILQQHIFSSIPTKLAIRTSVLSKRWRHVWSETPSLSIDCHRSESDPESVNLTLARHYSSPKITSFHLAISCKARRNIDNLIEFAMSRNTEKLSLDFHESYTGAYSFPDSFYASCSLNQLLLESATIDSIPTTVSWTSLKTLSLMGCVLSDESCAKILSGSPLLECLTLYCGELERLDLSKSPRVKSLDVEILEPVMEIVAPHVHRLRLSHSDESKCSLGDVSSLTEARLNIRCSKRLGFMFDDFGDPETGFANSLQVMVLETLVKLQNVEKLTLSLQDARSVVSPTTCIGKAWKRVNVGNRRVWTCLSRNS
ncbi:unnamed protein product [Microthlaspi erraticum]|uniref:At1g61320/AtMIF1 LRR domain-containing protein n=1 Tax=Microthlaspi erraticum TaxID=1685480 RepID=A0A6D2HW30_9BRAS|nr:unnamed protein product [Microthlaspi erraticum]